MRCIRVSHFGDPGVLELTEAPDLSPSPGEILVRLHAAGVNPVETYIRAGKYAALPPLPYTPGSDGAGIVEEAAGGGFEPGSRVYLTGSLTGTYAEQAVCRPDHLHPLPPHLPFEQGAAIGIPFATAYRALFNRGQACAGETVLVHGASGGVGTAAVQLARAAGLRVLGTAGTPEGLDLAHRNGAEAVFNHHDPDYLEQIKKAAGGGGLDLILEMLANKNLGDDLTMLGAGGRVVVIGSRGRADIDPRDAMTRDADIRGLVLMNAGKEELAAIHTGIGRQLAEGSICPVVGKKFPLAEAPRAHEAIMERGAAGKIVLTM